MIQKIDTLIAQTRTWQEQHRRAGRMIEVAACEIRLKALRDARAIMKEMPR